ncbi:MAG: HNH endonuclease [Carnobacterium sp.]|uniref:HNH endonuclease n=1 Tax=Carnobacterium sp. TaxID=48221 RepID=UPI003C778BF3
MSIFRQISANEEIFISTREKYMDFYKKYVEFAQNLSDKSGKVRSKSKSGKANSYGRYFIRLIIFYKKLSGEDLEDLSTFNSYNKLEKIKLNNEFKKFNNKSNHFYSATLNCYLAYVTYLNSKIEDTIDNNFNHRLNNEEAELVPIIEEYSEVYSLLLPNVRKNKKFNGSFYHYPRSVEEAIRAKIKSKWKCEYDSSHKTFTSNGNREQYIEAHHLIPMGAQDYFKNTIDFADNIICLCPNCHSKIHYAIREEREDMIEQLYKDRKNAYKKYGINVSEKVLLTMYGLL